MKDGERGSVKVRTGMVAEVFRVPVKCRKTAPTEGPKRAGGAWTENELGTVWEVGRDEEGSMDWFDGGAARKGQVECVHCT